MSSPIAVPSVARACTRWTASTPCPRRTVTLIASIAAGDYVAGVARGRSVAPPARPARQAPSDREGRAGARRDAEDDRAAAVGARGGRTARGRAAREAVRAADG